MAREDATMRGLMALEKLEDIGARARAQYSLAAIRAAAHGDARVTALVRPPPPLAMGMAPAL